MLVTKHLFRGQSGFVLSVEALALGERLLKRSAHSFLTRERFYTSVRVNAELGSRTRTARTSKFGIEVSVRGLAILAPRAGIAGRSRFAARTGRLVGPSDPGAYVAQCATKLMSYLAPLRPT